MEFDKFREVEMMVPQRKLACANDETHDVRTTYVQKKNGETHIVALCLDCPTAEMQKVEPPAAPAKPE